MLCCWLCKLIQMFVNAIKPERTITTSSNWTNTRGEQTTTTTTTTTNGKKASMHAADANGAIMSRFSLEELQQIWSLWRKRKKKLHKKRERERGKKGSVSRRRGKFAKKNSSGKKNWRKSAKRPTLWNPSQPIVKEKEIVLYTTLSLCLSLSLFLAGWNYKERKRKDIFWERERERESVKGRRHDGMFWAKALLKLIERKNGQS